MEAERIHIETWHTSRERQRAYAATSKPAVRSGQLMESSSTKINTFSTGKVSVDAPLGQDWCGWVSSWPYRFFDLCNLSMFVYVCFCILFMMLKKARMRSPRFIISFQNVEVKELVSRNFKIIGVTFQSLEAWDGDEWVHGTPQEMRNPWCPMFVAVHWSWNIIGRSGNI